eukprot:UN12062
MAEPKNRKKQRTKGTKTAKIPTIADIESLKYRDLLKVLRDNFPDESRKGLKTEELRKKINTLIKNNVIAAEHINKSNENESNSATASATVTYIDMVMLKLQFWENKLADLLLIKHTEESDYDIAPIPRVNKYELIDLKRFERMVDERNSKVAAARKLLSIEISKTHDMMERFAIVTGFIKPMCNLFTWLAQNPPSLSHGWGECDEYPLYAFEQNVLAKLCKIHKPKIDSNFCEIISK